MKNSECRAIYNLFERAYDETNSYDLLVQLINLIGDYRNYSRIRYSADARILAYDFMNSQIYNLI